MFYAFLTEIVEFAIALYSFCSPYNMLIIIGLKFFSMYGVVHYRKILNAHTVASIES